MVRHFFLAALAATLSAGLARGQVSYGIEWGTGKVICSDDGDTGPLHSDGDSYARAAEWDRRTLGEAALQCARELTPIDGGTWGQSDPFTGQDADGRTAEFRLYVLSDQYAWTLGSASEITDRGRRVALGDILSTPQFSERFCAAHSAFAIGAASFEGQTQANRSLARRRAANVAGQLVQARLACRVGQIPILFSINLGEFQNPEPAADSSPQRRVVVVAAEEATLGVNIRQALRTAIETQQVLRNFSVADYDLFEVESY